MKDILFALVAGGLGVVLLTLGYRLARILIPLWAFFAGFSVGAAVFADSMNAAFIGTTLGIVTGLVIGLVFAVLAYFFYSLAVVLLGATLGYWLGTWFVGLFGIDGGFFSSMVGVVVGAVFGVLTLGLNIAKWLLIFLTSSAGATAVVGGILVLFNKIELSAFDYTTAAAEIESSVLWSIVSLGLLLVGVVIQTFTSNDYVIESWATQYGGPKSNEYKSEDAKESKESE